MSEANGTSEASDSNERSEWMDCRVAAKSNRGGKRQPQSKKNGRGGLRSRTQGCKPTSESEKAPFFFVLGLTLGGAPPSGGREGGRNNSPVGATKQYR